ncbi:MAG: ThuA domain-containing protein [Bacteroidota bacterium]
MQRILAPLSLLLFLSLILFQACAPLDASPQSDQPAPTLDGKKVLFVYGGWKGHEPEVFMEYMVPWMESEGATVYVSDSLGIYKDSMLMESVDLIVQQWTMGKIKGPERKGLLKAIQNGAGFAGWHGGSGDSFREDTQYQFMSGGQFVAHPGGQIEHEINIVDHNDPITDGVEDFSLKSEQYYMHVDPNVKVLATTTYSGEHAYWIEGAVMPVIWKKQFGKGRVFYSSIGHSLEHLKVPNAMETVKRGVRWASESKYQPMEDLLQAAYQD